MTRLFFTIMMSILVGSLLAVSTIGTSKANAKAFFDPNYAKQIVHPRAISRSREVRIRSEARQPYDVIRDSAIVTTHTRERELYRQEQLRKIRKDILQRHYTHKEIIE